MFAKLIFGNCEKDRHLSNQMSPDCRGDNSFQASGKSIDTVARHALARISRRFNRVMVIDVAKRRQPVRMCVIASLLLAMACSTSRSHSNATAKEGTYAGLMPGARGVLGPDGPLLGAQNKMDLVQSTKLEQAGNRQALDKLWDSHRFFFLPAGTFVEILKPELDGDLVERGVKVRVTSGRFSGKEIWVVPWDIELLKAGDTQQ